MAALAKAAQVTKNVNNITKLFSNLMLSQNVNPIISSAYVRRVPLLRCALVHSTAKPNGLMEFFDEPKNWGKEEVKVGRSWRTEELRLKSNEDLHKLWYVLLKERNMLLTMEEASKDEDKIFPNPERIDKVEDSMCNLEQVVRERNRAYYMLETGETGERPAKLTYNALGLQFCYRMRQYPIPKFMNKKWHKMHMFGYQGYAVRKFLRLYREKLWNTRRKSRNQEFRHVCMLMRKFPNLDLEAVKEQFPSVDIEKARQSKRASGHYMPE